MLAILVKYGYYDSKKDVNDILKRLVSILNGFTDLPSLTETGTYNYYTALCLPVIALCAHLLEKYSNTSVCLCV